MREKQSEDPLDTAYEPGQAGYRNCYSRRLANCQTKQRPVYAIDGEDWGVYEPEHHPILHDLSYHAKHAWASLDALDGRQPFLNSTETRREHTYFRDER